MRTTLLDGESVLLAIHDKTGFFSAGERVGWMGPGDIGVADALFLSPIQQQQKIQKTTLWGSFFITNQRLIFEVKNGKKLMIYLDDVESFEHKTPGAFTSGVLYITVKNGNTHELILPEPSKTQRFLEKIYKTHRVLFIAKKAKHCENILDYNKAIHLWEKIGKYEQAKRIREKIRNEKKIALSQKVVHGNEITQTSIKDSVLSKSNIGPDKSLKNELMDLKELLDAGILTQDEFAEQKKKLLSR